MTSIYGQDVWNQLDETMISGITRKKLFRKQILWIYFETRGRPKDLRVFMMGNKAILHLKRLCYSWEAQLDCQLWIFLHWPEIYDVFDLAERGLVALQKHMLLRKRLFWRKRFVQEADFANYTLSFAINTRAVWPACSFFTGSAAFACGCSSDVTIQHSPALPRGQ